MVVLATEGLDHSHVDSTTVIRDIEDAGVTVHAAVLTARGARTSSRLSFGPIRSGRPGVGPPGFGRSGFDPAGSGAPPDGGFARWRIDRDLALNRAPPAGGGRRRDMLASMAAEATLEAVAAELLNQYLWSTRGLPRSSAARRRGARRPRRRGRREARCREPARSLPS